MSSQKRHYVIHLRAYCVESMILYNDGVQVVDEMSSDLVVWCFPPYRRLLVGRKMRNTARLRNCVAVDLLMDLFLTRMYLPHEDSSCGH